MFYFYDTIFLVFIFLLQSAKKLKTLQNKWNKKALLTQVLWSKEQKMWMQSLIKKNNLKFSHFPFTRDNIFTVGKFMGKRKKTLHLTKRDLVDVYCNTSVYFICL